MMTETRFSAEEIANGLKREEISPEFQAGWNSHVRLHPNVFAANLLAPPFQGDELEVSWLTADGIMGMNINRKNLLGETELLFRASFELQKHTGALQRVEIAPHLQGQGLGTLLTRRVFDLFRRCGVKTMTGHMGLANGGYTWTKLGFMPPPQAYDELRQDFLWPRMEALGGCIPEPTRSQMATALLANDPTAIFLIASLTTPTHDVPVGRWIFAHAFWNHDLNKHPDCTPATWESIKQTALVRLEALQGKMVENEHRECTRILENTPATSLPDLLDLPMKVSGIPAGKLALVGTAWDGIIDFENPVQMAIYNSRNRPDTSPANTPATPHKPKAGPT